MRVKVYFNLHKKLFSVVALEGEDKGRVINHVSSIDLSMPIFRVQKAGRERVLKEKKKNVHAYVMGYICDLKSDTEIENIEWVKATYNPYKYSSFVSVKDENAIRTCRYARLSLKKGLMVSGDYICNTSKNYRYKRG
ncbi:hypothetical protein N9W84_00835 [bacterium]|nr:hypothetical protein [bacterium]